MSTYSVKENASWRDLEYINDRLKDDNKKLWGQVLQLQNWLNMAITESQRGIKREEQLKRKIDQVNAIQQEYVNKDQTQKQWIDSLMDECNQYWSATQWLKEEVIQL